jgi:hypothetical protein
VRRDHVRRDLDQLIVEPLQVLKFSEAVKKARRGKVLARLKFLRGPGNKSGICPILLLKPQSRTGVGQAAEKEIRNE